MLKANEIYVDKYLSKVKEGSYKSANTQKNRIIECLEYIKKPIHDIKKSDVRNYFENVLNKKDIVIRTKNTYRLIIKAFFTKIEQYLPEKHLNAFINPVPKFDFSINRDKIGKATEKEVVKFSRVEEDGKANEILKILRMSRKTEYRDFIIFGLLAQTGMRISECLSIKIEDIDFKERTIDTGLVNGARKSFNKIENKGIMFFFRENFKPYLQNYVLFRNKKTGWLFNGKSNNHYTDTAFRGRVIKYYGKKYQKFHCFRQTIITYFEIDGLSRNKIEMLMNHSPSSIEDKHYRKLSIKEKRAIYDQYFPYKQIPYF